MKRIIWHWTGGAHKANSTDRAAYHYLIEGDGTVINGTLPPEANLSTSDGIYAAHVRNLNTGSIGIALCAMWDAQEAPFRWGKAPITEAQVAALVAHTHVVAKRYGIPIRRDTVLTHAEVEKTLAVPQRGKWDIVVLPGMTGPGDAIEVGDKLRLMTIAAADKTKPDPDVIVPEGWEMRRVMVEVGS